MSVQSRQQSLQLSLHEQRGRIFTPAFTLHIFLANVAVYWLAHVSITLYHFWSKFANSNPIFVCSSHYLTITVSLGTAKFRDFDRLWSPILIKLFRNSVTGSDESVWGHVTGASASSSFLLLRKSLSDQFSCFRNWDTFTVIFLWEIRRSFNRLTWFVRPNVTTLYINFILFMILGYFIFLLPVFLRVLETCRYFALKMYSNIRDQFNGCNKS